MLLQHNILQLYRNNQEGILCVECKKIFLSLELVQNTSSTWPVWKLTRDLFLQVHLFDLHEDYPVPEKAEDICSSRSLYSQNIVVK